MLINKYMIYGANFSAMKCRLDRIHSCKLVVQMHSLEKANSAYKCLFLVAILPILGRFARERKRESMNERERMKDRG